MNDAVIGRIAATAGIVGAIVIAAWQLSKRGSVDVTSPVVNIDSIEPIAQRDVEVRMREEPPERCLDVDVIRMVRAHTVMTVDRDPKPFARDEDSHPGRFKIAGHSVTTDARGTFTLRIERGELVRIDRVLAGMHRDIVFRQYSHRLPTELCEGDPWFAWWSYAWPHGDAKRYYWVMIDALD